MLLNMDADCSNEPTLMNHILRGIFESEFQVSFQIQ